MLDDEKHYQKVRFTMVAYAILFYLYVPRNARIVILWLKLLWFFFCYLCYKWKLSNVDLFSNIFGDLQLWQKILFRI